MSAALDRPSPLSWRVLLSWLPLLVVVGSFAFAGPATLRGVRYVEAALPYALPLDPQEGFALWEADRWRAGHGLYVPLERYSFVSAPYPPVHPLLMLLVGSSQGPHVFWGGRLVSLFAMVLLSIVAAVLVRRTSGSWLGGIVSMLMIAAQPTFQLWSMRIKPDMLGLALTTVGLLVATHRFMRPSFLSPGWRGWISMSVVAIPFVLAHFTKQTLVAAPLAVAICFALRDRRAALRFCVVSGLLVALGWAGFDLATHGQYTYHVWVLHKLGYKYDLWLKQVNLLVPLWPMLVLGLGGLLATWRRPNIVNAYLLVAPLSLAGAGVQGAHHNHLLETGLALALAGGQAVGIGLITLRANPMVWQKTAAVSLTVLLLALQWRFLATPSQWYERAWNPDPEYGRFVDFMRATPGEILADDVALLYAAGKPLRYDDPSAMGPAARMGLWDEGGLLEDIEHKRFSAIMIPFNTDTDGRIDPSGRWTPAVLNAISIHYRIKFVDTFTIYEPKP